MFHKNHWYRQCWFPRHDRALAVTKNICNEDSCLLGYEIMHIVTNFSDESSSGLLLLGRMCTAVFRCTYTGCNRRNGPDFGRVFLRSNYTDITQNTYIQSWTVTEILARENSGILWCLRTVLVSVTSFSHLLELHSYVRANVAPATLATGGL